MIRRIIASIIMFALLSSSMTSAYTGDDKIMAQSKLGKYEQYAITLDAALPKISQEKLEELRSTLTSALTGTEGDKANFMTYALISLDLELQRRNSLTYEDINTEDALIVEHEIMQVQENLESEISEFISAAISSWQESTRYKETGNFKMLYDMAVKDFMQFEGELSISNYILENQIFDQLFSGDISANYSTVFPGEYGGDVDISFSSNAEIIAKDGDVYLKFDDIFSQSKSSNEYFDLDFIPMIEKLKELSEQNTYLKIPGYDDYAYLQTLNTTDITHSVSAQIEHVFSAPLLKAQSKTPSGYTLVPTKHFCDIGKKASGIFDPFAGDECSQGQYEDMLEDFYDTGMEIFLTIGDIRTLDISLGDGNESIDMSISWDNTSLKQLQGNFINTSSSYYGDRHVYFDFIPQESFVANIGDDTFDGNISLLIDRNATIYSGDFSLNIEDTLSSTGIYRNKTLSLGVEGKDGKSTLSCQFDGPLKKNFINIQGGCNIHSPEIEYQIPGVQNITIDSEITYNGKNNANNLDFSLAIDADTQNYLNFELTNTSKIRSVHARNIMTPEKTRDVTVFMSEIYDDIYDDYSYYDDSEYSYNEYDDYYEDCYTYTSGDSTCYKYYDDKSETCEYLAETNQTECSEYIYSDWEYETKEYSFDDHDTTCYIYNNGNSSCYEYYDDKEVSCYYTAETDESSCETYDYSDYDYYDDYYYDDEYYDEDSEDAGE